MVKTLDELKKEIMDKAHAEIQIIEHDYNKGMSDCARGIYDKWFRYNRMDDGFAYDEGWVIQNRVTENETVQFVNA